MTNFSFHIIVGHLFEQREKSGSSQTTQRNTTKRRPFRTFVNTVYFTVIS